MNSVELTIYFPEILFYLPKFLIKRGSGEGGQMHPWKASTPSAQFLVDPDCGARSIIRDTGECGVRRFHWYVIPLGRYHPIAEGRTGELARARSVAEMALRAYAEDRLANP
jgi:hypothetical protein